MRELVVLYSKDRQKKRKVCVVCVCERCRCLCCTMGDTRTGVHELSHCVHSPQNMKWLDGTMTVTQHGASFSCSVKDEEGNKVSAHSVLLETRL